MRIFDLCICSFANAQAKYHSTVQEKVEGYVKEYLDGIKRSPDPQLGEIDLGTGRGVEKNWRAGWQPFVDVIENFAITKPGASFCSSYLSDTSFGSGLTLSTPTCYSTSYIPRSTGITYSYPPTICPI